MEKSANAPLGGFPYGSNVGLARRDVRNPIRDRRGVSASISYENSCEKECEKPRALCPNNLAKKKGELLPIVKFRLLLSFSLSDSGNCEMRYFRGDLTPNRSITCPTVYEQVLSNPAGPRLRSFAAIGLLGVCHRQC